MFSEKPTKPTFKLPMLSVATEKGKKFVLKCGVTGYPKPVITWLNKGQKVKTSLDVLLAFPIKGRHMDHRV